MNFNSKLSGFGLVSKLPTNYVKRKENEDANEQKPIKEEGCANEEAASKNSDKINSFQMLDDMLSKMEGYYTSLQLLKQDCISKITKQGSTESHLKETGFSDEHLEKYFTVDKEASSDGNVYNLNQDIELNGRKVDSVKDLAYELFEQPIDNLINRVRAGVVAMEDFVSELEKLGLAKDIKASGSETNGDLRVEFTVNGEKRVVEYRDLTKISDPRTKNTNAISISTGRNQNLSEKDLRRLGFTDSQLNEYFERKDNNILFTLKSGIVIDNYKINNLEDLYYFVILLPIINAEKS